MQLVLDSTLCFLEFIMKYRYDSIIEKAFGGSIFCLTVFLINSV